MRRFGKGLRKGKAKEEVIVAHRLFAGRRKSMNGREIPAFSALLPIVMFFALGAALSGVGTRLIRYAE